MARQNPKTPSWQSRKKRLHELVEEAFKPADIREARDQMLALLQQSPHAVGPPDRGQQRLDLSALTEACVAEMLYRSPDLVQWYFEFSRCRRDLLDLAKQHVPQLLTFSDAELEDFLSLMLLDLPDPWRLAANYLAPDTPAKVLPTGDLLVPKGSRLTNYQAGQIRDFVNSQNAGQRGRPRNVHATPSKIPRGAHQERTAKAALAYKNSQNGIHWTVTARAVCPDLDLHDKRQRDQARKRVDRLIYAGEKTERQRLKARPPQKKLDA
jgi:hypothetical protein